MARRTALAMTTLDTRPSAALAKAEFVLTIQKHRNTRCPTITDLVTGDCYMLEPSTPGYAVVMSMLDRVWPDTARYKNAA